MAKSKRGRAYKLTPRRKAALAKAQKASARKRSRRGALVAGALGATLVAGGAAYYGRSRQQSARSAGFAKLNVVRQTTRVQGPRRTRHRRSHLVLLPAPEVRNVTVLKMGDIGERNRTKSKPPSRKIFKVDSSGVVTKTRFNADKSKARVIYDANRRRKYWQAKPVGGTPRKTPVRKPKK